MVRADGPETGQLAWCGWIRLDARKWRKVLESPSDKPCWDELLTKFSQLYECVALPQGIEPNPGFSLRE